MILVDVNLLVYAHNAGSHHYAAARQWLMSRLEGSESVGLSWAAILGFVRVSTHPRIFSPAASTVDAWRKVELLLSNQNVWIPQPTERHAEVLGELLAEPGVHGNLVPDAHLAALAIEHGLTLCSTDGDFARFKRLRWLNPLESSD